MARARELMWKQFSALLPKRKVEHPLSCYKSCMPDRIVFENLLQLSVFRCAYHRIADKSCLDTTLGHRCDEWIEAGVMEKLREMALAAYARTIDLDTVIDVAVDGAVSSGRFTAVRRQARPLGGAQSL